MKQLFLPYELALIAKEKGFDQSCLSYYPMGKDKLVSLRGDYWDNTALDNLMGEGAIAAPLYQQIIDWFRYKEIRIIEKPAFGWDIYVEYDGGYITHSEHSTLNKAIEEAFKII